MHLLCPACQASLPAPGAMSPVVACPRCALQVDVTAIGTVAGKPRFVPEIDRAGQTVGGFRVEGRLGAGGMDTSREVELLNELWNSGRPPWRIWSSSPAT